MSFIIWEDFSIKYDTSKGEIVNFSVSLLRLSIWALSWENLSSGFLTRSDTNRAVQLLKMARGWKFRIQEVKGLHYLCSENKGADQLRGDREADLRLCFRICKKPVFSWRGSYVKIAYVKN